MKDESLWRNLEVKVKSIFCDALKALIIVACCLTMRDVLGRRVPAGSCSIISDCA